MIFRQFLIFIIILDEHLETLIKDKCLAVIDDYRHRHAANPLKWSNSLYRKALDISDRLADNDVGPKNLSKYERPGLSLDYVPLTQLKYNETEYTPCVYAATDWYGQKINYNYGAPKVTNDNRDFTQLVWKSGKTIGIAKSISTDGKGAYIAAVYEPVANPNPLGAFRKHLLVGQSNNPISPDDIYSNIEEEKTAKEVATIKNFFTVAKQSGSFLPPTTERDSLLEFQNKKMMDTSSTPNDIKSDTTAMFTEDVTNELKTPIVENFFRNSHEEKTAPSVIESSKAIEPVAEQTVVAPSPQTSSSLATSASVASS